jgi:hypothetical protein
MIQDLDKTLEKLFYERGRFSRNDIDVSFDQPNGDWSSRLARPTLNVWAFDLRENMKLRNMTLGTERENGMGTRRRMPLRYDITYLVTAWARKVEDEHQLLWRGLGALVQVTILRRDECEGSVREQAYDLPILVGTIGERLPNTSDLWSVLNNQMRLGFTFIVTVAVDPLMSFDAPLVLERTTRFGESQEPARQKLDVLDTEFVHRARPEDAPPGALPADGEQPDGAKKKRR